MKIDDIVSNTFQMYHGGKKWYTIPTDLISGKKGKTWYGVGIYTTNFYETARKYGKGSRVVHILDIDKNYKDLDNVNIVLDEAISFIKNLRGLRFKSEIVDRIKKYDDKIPLSVLHNNIINSDAAPGELGKEVSDFLSSKGADASYISQSGKEFWLLIFNPRIIKSFNVIDPATIGSKFPFELPRINPKS